MTLSQIWVKISSPSLTSYVHLGTFLNSTKTQLLHLQKGDKKTSKVLNCGRRLSNIEGIEHDLASCLADSWRSVEANSFSFPYNSSVWVLLPIPGLLQAISKDNTRQRRSFKGTSHKQDPQSTACNGSHATWTCRSLLRPSLFHPACITFISVGLYGKCLTLSRLTAPWCLFSSFHCFRSPAGHIL